MIPALSKVIPVKSKMIPALSKVIPVKSKVIPVKLVKSKMIPVKSNNCCVQVCSRIDWHYRNMHWKMLLVKCGVPISLCEQKWSFKFYRHFWSVMIFIATNNSHTFKRWCRNNRSRLASFQVLDYGFFIATDWKNIYSTISIFFCVPRDLKPLEFCNLVRIKLIAKKVKLIRNQNSLSRKSINEYNTE